MNVDITQDFPFPWLMLGFNSTHVRPGRLWFSNACTARAGFRSLPLTRAPAVSPK
ncbi:hypothetical protein QFZ40_002948 [Arthrobacter pascens]|nr:hypothetical protein [Arthrobacter pascens]